MEQGDLNTVKNTSAKKRKLIYLLIIVPFFISGFITFSLFQNNKSNPILPESENNRSTSTTASGSNLQIYYPENIANDGDKHREYILQNAKKATVIDIGECLPIPQIAEVAFDRPFTLQNSDAKEHTIQIAKNFTYTVPPQSSIFVKANFGKGEGIYHYICDDSTQTIGVFILQNP